MERSSGENVSASIIIGENLNSFLFAIYRNTSVEIMNKFQEPPSEVTIVQWSSSGRMLAVGCFHGDVLLYSYGEDELSWSQTMCVCGGSVTALTWSEDSL